MALHPFPEGYDVDLNDSDETFFCPDLDMDLDADNQGNDFDFERTFNKFPFHPSDFRYMRSDSGENLGETFFDQADNALPEVPDSDETYFEPPQQPQHQQLPDSDETFFEPAETRDTHRDSNQQPEEGRNLDADGPDGHTGGLPSCEQQPPVDLDETFFEQHEEYVVEDVLAAVQEHPDQLAPESSLCTHDLEWSERWNQANQTGGQDHDEAADGGAPTPHEIYIQLQDPLTQELRIFRVPGMQAGADSMKLFTQDLCWTQMTQHVVASEEDQSMGNSSEPKDLEHQDERTARGTAPPGEQGPDTTQLFTQDLGWTQTQHVVASEEDQSMGNCSESKDLEHQDERTAGGTAPPVQGPDTTQLFTQDLGWTQTHHFPASPPEDQVMDGGNVGAVQQGVGWAAQPSAAHQGAGGMASSETSLSMDVGPVPPQRKSCTSSSLESSEAQVVPSLPSFEDDALPPSLPWPLWPEDQPINIEEIVASLSNMSFNLTAVEVAAPANLVGPLAAEAAVAAESCVPATPSPSPTSPQPGQQAPSSSPTFSITAFRRGRRPRPRASTWGTTGPPDGRQQAGAPGTASIPGPGPASGSSNGPGKRKRAGAGTGNHPRRMPAPTSCSPSSPPRQKARRTCSAPALPSTLAKERPQMIAVYSRLQELRFLMQDIIAGREPLPVPEEVSKMRQEVLVIQSNLEQAGSRSKGHQLSKAKLRQEEARQVADKLIHQLQVLAESHESCASEEASENNTLATSRSDISAKNLPEDNPVKLKEEPKSSYEVEKCYQKKQMKGRKKKNGKKKCSKKGHDSCYTQENYTEVFQEENSEVTCCGNICAVEKYSDSLENSEGEKSKTYKIEEISLNDAEKSSIDNRNSLTAGAPLASISTKIVPHFLPTSSSELPHDSICMVMDNSCSHPPQEVISNDNNNFNTIENSEVVISGGCDSQIAELQQCMEFESASSLNANSDLNDKQDLEKREEYQQIVNLIKSKCAAPSSSRKPEIESEDYIWRGGPLKLTGILLPKKSELEPIDNFPPNFWGDPQAPIPDEWINMLEWDD